MKDEICNEYCCAHHRESQPQQDGASDSHLLRFAGIVEIAVRNPNVASYMDHWEKRALTAESRLTQSRESLEETRGLLHDAWRDAASVLCGRCRAGSSMPRLAGKTWTHAEAGIDVWTSDWTCKAGLLWARYAALAATQPKHDTNTQSLCSTPPSEGTEK